MTDWIRCSDRMPMGEACEVRCHDCGWGESERIFPSATVETLRHAFADDRGGDWIDRTEWRPVEEPNGLGKVFGAWPGDESDEEIETVLRDEVPHAETTRRILAEMDAHPERFVEGMHRAYQEAVEGMEGNPSVGPSVTAAEREQDILRAALNHHGIREQLAMLQEECGELVAAVSRWRRGRMGAFPAMIEEIADVEILIDQVRLELGAEIDQARARKVARLRERLE